MLHTLLSITLSVSAVLSEESWTYSNQEAWADITNSKCGASSGQSPININTAQTESCPSDSDLDWSLNDDALSFTVSNSASHHNIKIVPANDGDKFNLAKLKNNFLTTSKQHEYYCLDSFHIHWGSEHTINSQRSALEIHFVHFSCDYGSFSAAFEASATDPHTLAVVAVLFETGKENVFLKGITDRITSLQSPGQTITLSSSGDGDDDDDDDDDSEIKMDDLFNVERGDSFYHYKGSLTTPTCDPIVSWHVMKNKMQLTTAQEQRFRMIVDTDNSVVVSNYRKVQPASTVYLCGGDSGDESDD